jgi:hypothetical protein
MASFVLLPASLTNLILRLVQTTGTNSSQAAATAAEGRRFAGMAARGAGFRDEELDDHDSQEMQLAIHEACSERGECSTIGLCVSLASVILMQ